MTDKKIIKALECCSNNVLYEQCVGCPYEKYLDKGHTCIIKATKNALDLINRQKAEIERLNTLISKTNEHRGEVIHAITHIDEIKSEAVKEFAERLLKKELESEYFSHIAFQALNFDTNKLLKGLVGDDNSRNIDKQN